MAKFIFYYKVVVKLKRISKTNLKLFFSVLNFISRPFYCLKNFLLMLELGF